MISSIVKVGDRIELIRVTPAVDKSEQKVYVSQLLDLVDSANMNIAVPIEAGHLIPLEIGGKYDMRFLTVQGLYVCRAVITNRFKQNNLYFLAVNLITDLKKDQRRQYYRLDKVLSIKYHIMSEEEIKITDALEKQEYSNDREKRYLEELLIKVTGKEEKGIMSNISGGGLKFSASVMHEKGKQLMIDLTLDDANDSSAHMVLRGRIIASDSVANKSMMYEHRVEFFNVNREVRERIVRYVFTEERKQRKKDIGTT